MNKRTLAINNLIQYVSEEDDEIIVLRLLYVDNINDIAFVIDINAVKGLPEFQRYSRLAQDLADKRAIINSDDPWARIVSENELSEKDREIRDRAWAIIKDLAKPENEPDVYYKKVRGKLVLEAARKHNTTPTTVYKYWRKFLQRGKVINALLPDYQNSGGAGKERKVVKKLGRRRKFSHVVEIGEGINVDEKIKKIFRAAISQFYYDPKEVSLATAYNLMLEKYFSEDFIVDKGVRKSLLVPQEEKPTYKQFSYFYNKEKNIQKEVGSRKGKAAYALLRRPILGSSTNEVFGPGSRYEIDATVADVYLVSRFNRSWIIGRPIVYIVIDVFSRMIAGVYVGLEGPSWLGAMMALTNTVADKVGFCAAYGIPISEEEWACHSLPDIILADGGELAGKAVETLANNLRVRIETASPYRGDLKGIVERSFRIIHEKVKPFLPGYVIKDAHKRRGFDYRLDAKLDIYQFTKIIITGILQHNRGFLNYYERDAEMITADVRATPIELWKWGVKNRTGTPRYFPEDIVKLNLLPSDTGRITRGGILFKDMEYSCERAIKEGWFEKGSRRNGERVQIVYDMRDLNYVYLRESDGRSFEKCHLLPTEAKYMNRDYYEIEHYRNQEQLDGQLSLPEKQQEFADLSAITKSVVAEAEELAVRDRDQTASKASRVANITDNRQSERAYIREQEAFELGKEAPQDKPAVVVSINRKEVKQDEVENDLDYPDELEMLSRVRNQKKEGQKDESGK